ncbi:hypothetical protein [Streptomyces yunnanensis]|uniref:Lipoprotein n=1 Tax=Streptomyces yunnanensis TaxID=156453 RepID=A0A9X8QYH4_9ACTN|nr:hypothetical protein [Streptomyces yunnanensis]SHN08553.1 hypothetical protein SAMN05216268_11989 [Streptomyces yunnanensis]
MSPATAIRNAARRLLGLLSVLLVFALSACSSQNRATSPKEVRRLAGGAQVEESRKRVEKHLRDIADAYDKKTPLALALVTVGDICTGGTAKEWLYQNGADQFKIRCAMHLTAYYGADPRHIGDVLEGIFTAGDHYSVNGAPKSVIPFNHDDFRRRLVDYYRGRGPNPTGPNLPEMAQVSTPSQTLSWDTVRSSQRKLVQEPDPCMTSDPPVTRCLHEPAQKTVADIRKEYGMVFKLEIPVTYYYEMSKRGEVVKS